MNAEFNWWLLIVGLVLGAALTWLVMAETVRRDIDVSEQEQRSEAAWIAALLGGAGRNLSADRVEEVLRLHREYLAAPPPDEPADQGAVEEAIEDAVVDGPVETAGIRRANDGDGADRGSRPND